MLKIATEAFSVLEIVRVGFEVRMSLFRGKEGGLVLDGYGY